MKLQEMRSEVDKMYDGKKWKDRVAKMSESQVTAIYLSQKRRVSNGNRFSTAKVQAGRA